MENESPHSNRYLKIIIVLLLFLLLEIGAWTVLIYKSQPVPQEPAPREQVIVYDSTE